MYANSKKIMRKNGMSNVVSIILVIALGILLLIIIGKYIAQQSLKAAINVCQVSALAQANTKLIKNPLGDTSPFSLECDTRYVNLYNNKVEIGLNPSRTKVQSIWYNNEKVTKFAALDDYIVNQVVAEEMHICFYEFGEGKIDVFDTSMTEGGAVKSLFSGNDVCFLCSEISFMDDVPKDKTFTGFMDYISKTYIGTGNEKKVTYLQYFNQPGLGKVNWTTFIKYINDDKIVFSTKNNYAVVFTKQDMRLRTLWSILSLVIKADNANNVYNNYYAYVIPVSELNNRCDMLVN